MTERVRATSLGVSLTHLDVTLQDGRMLRIPITLFPRLQSASFTQLSHWQWIGEGLGIEWPELDEHLSIEGFLKQTPYFIPKQKPPIKSRSSAKRQVLKTKV